MKLSEYLWNEASLSAKRAMPLLSFPMVQKLGISVKELILSADRQAEAMVLAASTLPTLAAVTPMDLSVEAEAFGAELSFGENEVPTVAKPLVADMDGALALAVPSVGAGRTGLCIEAVSKACRMIQDKPVLAGVIGPFSLAGRLVGVTEALYICYDEPELLHLLLQKVSDFIVSYTGAMKRAGASGVIMAEPLAGILSPALFSEFSQSYVSEIIKAVQTEDFAVVYHNCGGSVLQLTDGIFAQGASAYHFGNSVSMRDILDKAPENALCMGNIDPAGQFAGGTPESMRGAVQKLMSECAPFRNFLPSSGCDIPPQAKWENISAFFETVSGWRAGA